MSFLALARTLLGHALLAATLAVLFLLVLPPVTAAVLVALGFYAFEVERLFRELRACGCDTIEALGLALLLDGVALVILRTVAAILACVAVAYGAAWLASLPLRFA